MKKKENNKKWKKKICFFGFEKLCYAVNEADKGADTDKNI